MNNSDRKNRVRFVIVFMVPVIIIAGLSSIFLYNFSKNQIRQQTHQRLLEVVSVAVNQIDANMHASLLKSDLATDQAYRVLQEQLLKIKNSSSDVVRVYTIRIQGSDLISILDSNLTPGTKLSLGHEFLIDNPEVQETIQTLTSPIAYIESYEKDTGSVFSGFAPIYTSDGKRDGILGIDILEQGVMDYEKEVLWYLIIFFFIITIISAFIGWQLSNYYYRPIQALNQWVNQLAEGQSTLQYEPTGDVNLQNLGRSISQLNDKMARSLNTLDQRVSLRTAELEQRVAYMEAAAKVQQVFNLSLDPDQIMHFLVETIREKFGLYYVGLFMVDPTNTWAVLQAGTGKAGQILLGDGQKIRIGEGLVGWVVANAESRVTLEVGQDAIRLSTPELPLTRSEAVIPLINQGRSAGALSLYSDRSGLFDRLFLDVLQMMASQLSIGLENARLFFELKKNYVAMQNSIQHISTQAWSEFLSHRPVLGYQANPQGVIPLHESSALVHRTKSNPVSDVTIKGSELFIPIKVRGKIIGDILAKKPTEGKNLQAYWSAEETRLMQDFVDQLVISLDNARLYSVSQRSAERERVLADVTARVRTSTNVNTILQVAIQELAEALHVPKGSILLKPTQPESEMDFGGAEHG